MIFNMIKLIVLGIIVLQLCVGKVRSQSDTAECGVPKMRINKVILNGYETVPGAWPWHTAVYQRKGINYVYSCGGTLVSENFILTAAHCVISPENGHQISKRNIFIRLGVHSLHDFNCNMLQQHSILAIYIHPNHLSNSVQNDIAILELATAAQLNNYVQPACLGLEQDLTGKYGTVIGWGRTENEEVSPTLKSTLMPVIDFYTCLKSDRELFGATLSEGIICAGYTNGTTVCNGDSGSGLFFEHGKAWYLGGIVSYTGQHSFLNPICNKHGYGGFTNVHMYLSWIRSITGLQKEALASRHRLLFVDYSEVKAHFFELTQPNGRKNTYLSADIKDQCKAIDVVTKEYSNYLLPENCGKADAFTYPWMATIRDKWTQQCAGTLINNRYILTTAQDVNRFYSPIQVTLGEYVIGINKNCTELTKCNPVVQKYEVECVIQHPNYNFHTYENDIALLRLAQQVTFNEFIHPICLPMTQSLRQLNLLRYIMTVWRGSNDPVREYSVSPVKTNRCLKSHFLHQLGLHCGGLSVFYIIQFGGAPLVEKALYDERLRLVQFGIVSSLAKVRKRRTRFLYTNVSVYVDWVMANLRP